MNFAIFRGILIFFFLVLGSITFISASCEDKKAEETKPAEGVQEEVPVTKATVAIEGDYYKEGAPEAIAKWQEAMKLITERPHDYDKPLKLIDEALGIDPKYKVGYYSRGSILLNKYNDVMDPRLVDEAIEAFQKAVDLGANWIGLHNNLAFALRIMGRNEEAIKHLLVAYELNPKSTLVLNNLFEAYFNEGKPVEAKKYLDLAMKIDKTDPITKHNWKKFNAALQGRTDY